MAKDCSDGCLKNLSYQYTLHIPPSLSRLLSLPRVKNATTHRLLTHKTYAPMIRLHSSDKSSVVFIGEGSVSCWPGRSLNEDTRCNIHYSSIVRRSRNV
ncbi:MAG: hypothetical protein LZF62_360022 [Nitrospira sp.]|nr:MAG: hypothetical protein LZF62_360022 [Nitrospira sp.]